MPPDDGDVHLYPLKFDPIEDGVNHPTISQDWTNREVNDRNRLLALQGRNAFNSLHGKTSPRGIDLPRSPQPFTVVQWPSEDNFKDLETLQHPRLSPFDSEDGKGVPALAHRPGAIVRVFSSAVGSDCSEPVLDESDNMADEYDAGKHDENYVRTCTTADREMPELSATQQSSNHLSYQEPPPNVCDGEADDDLDNHNRVQQLLLELDALKAEKQHLEARMQGPPKRFQIIYRVDHSPDELPKMYLDRPQWLKGDKEMTSLQGQLPVNNVDSYLDRHSEVVFIVFRDANKAGFESRIDDEAQNVRWLESSCITSARLARGLEYVFERLSKISNRGVHINVKASRMTLAAPYLAFYHYREEFVACASKLDNKTFEEWSLLLEYIEDNFGEEFDEVNGQMNAGTIHREFIQYLVKDGDVLISRDGHRRSAYMAIAEPVASTSTEMSVPDERVFQPLHSKQQTVDSIVMRHMKRSSQYSMDQSFSNVKMNVWAIRAEVWEFDGNFQKSQQTIHLRIPQSSSQMLSIVDLEFFPIRFAKPEVVTRLRNIGLEFWKSRFRRYVSCRSSRGMGNAKCNDPRYMIDPATQMKLHKNREHAKNQSLRDDLGPEQMFAKDPPPDPLLLLLPSTIHGFNIQNKRWEELEVARIHDVSWNKEAFESLVVEPFTKTLIKALVMQQLEEEKGTDLIAGKGQGLIVVVHGGPGTGKTFTAETVAEIAEKPLYRVTCGDLGTEPTEVEKYLESVLYLGKIWDCVVLLDEADVYLEERSMESLARNALVSVFLRVLEYYEGILILTSNRVGTFDESFKSRIQLSLHYEKLNLSDMRTIWRNFLQRLQTFEEVGINFDDIERHINDLARNDLNGRQIRNAITTSRQLAQHLEKDLDYGDLQQVIKIALKFDKHTTDMQGGMNDDERKREDGIRP